jgi:hypothetical protein
VPQLHHTPAINVKPGQQHVMLAIPVGQPVDAEMMDFLWSVAWDLSSKDIAADLLLLQDGCHVDDNRNFMVWKFLQTKCTDLLFIDADTVGPKSNVVDILKFDRDVVAGLYPYKSDELNFPVRLLPKGVVYEDDGCVEVEAVPTGFLRMRRSVLEKLRDAVPGFYNKEVKEPSDPIPEIFRRETVPGIGRMSGDFIFCQKWRELDGQIYVDPTLHFQHIGHKSYCGNVGIFWAQKAGQQTPAFDKAIKTVASGNAIGPDFASLQLNWGNPYCATAGFLEACYLTACEADGPILETGSGLSTLMLGLGAMKSGVKVHALEHEVDYYWRTLSALKRYGITNVRLHYAPLGKQVYGDRSCIWYSIPNDLPDNFSLVVCDGPQRRYGRDGLFKILGNRISNAKAIFDDAHDNTELEAVSSWAESLNRAIHIVEDPVRPFIVSTSDKVTLSAA